MDKMLNILFAVIECAFGIIIRLAAGYFMLITSLHIISKIYM